MTASAPYMPDDFDKAGCRLPQFALEEWEGWLFVNLDPHAPPLAARLAPLQERLAHYQMGRYRTLFRVDEVWQTNWKILFQNFMEPYHLFAVHHTSVDPVLPTRQAHVPPGGPGFCLYKQERLPGVAYEYDAAMQNPNPALTDDEENSVYVFGAFPAQVVSVSAERTFWMSLMPLAVDQVRVFWGVDVHPDAQPEGTDQAQRIEALKANFEAINNEDKSIVAATAQNANALAAEPGHLSYKETTLWYFQKYLARMLTGSPV